MKHHVLLSYWEACLLGSKIGMAVLGQRRRKGETKHCILCFFTEHHYSFAFNDIPRGLWKIPTDYLGRLHWLISPSSLPSKEQPHLLKCKRGMLSQHKNTLQPHLKYIYICNLKTFVIKIFVTNYSQSDDTNEKEDTLWILKYRLTR